MDIWYTKEEANKLKIEEKLREEFSRLYSKIYKDLSSIEAEHSKRFTSEAISSYIIEDIGLTVTVMPYNTLDPLFGISTMLCNKYMVTEFIKVFKDGKIYKIPKTELDKVISIIKHADDIISATNYGLDLPDKYLYDGTHFDCTRMDYINRIKMSSNKVAYSLPKPYTSKVIEYVNKLLNSNPVKYLPSEAVRVVQSPHYIEVAGTNYKFIYDVWVKLVFYHYKINSQSSSIKCIYDGIQAYIPKSTVSDFILICKLYNKLVTETDYSGDILKYTTRPDFNALRRKAIDETDNEVSVTDKAKSILSSFFKLK